MENRFEIFNKSDKIAVIDIDGEIGYGWFEDGVTAKDIKQQLKEIASLKADRIIVNINSPGGSLSHAISIHDILKENPAQVETRIYGMTASAATIIAMAGDVILMSDNALFMPHLSSTIAMGNKNDLGAAVDVLENADDRIANIYAKRTGKTKEYHLEQMEKYNGNGEWLTADEAKEMGYVDEIFEPKHARVAANASDLKRYNLPIPKNLEDNKMDDVKTMISDLKTWLQDTFAPKKAEGEPVDMKVYDQKVTEIEAKYADFEAKITEKEDKITALKAENDTLTGEKTALEAEVSALKALPVDRKDTDPDIGDVKTPGNPFDAAANEMKTKLF